MKLLRAVRGPGNAHGRRLVGLVAATSLLLPTGVVAGLTLATSAPAGASITDPVSDGPGTVYVPIQPCRLIDTVPGSGFTDDGHTLIPGDETLTTPNLHNACGGQIPSSFDIDAVVANITAVNPSVSGYLTAFGAGQTFPATSTVNFVAGQTIANEATISTGRDTGDTGYNGEITVLNYQGSVDVIVDVQGYYTHDYGELIKTNAGPLQGCVNNSDIGIGCGLYYPLSPQRVFDTRTASGYQGQNQTLGPQSQQNFFAGDEPFLPGGVLPVDTVAVVLNVTAVNPTQNTYLTVWGTGSPMPQTSNLNIPAGTVLPNRVIVPVGANGQVSIFNWAGNTNVVVDLDGYFSAEQSLFNDSGPDTYCASPVASTCYGAFYFPLITPQRVADTRATAPYEDHGQTLGAGSIRTVTILPDHYGPSNPDPTDTHYAPPSFVAVDGNVTITDATGPSYLTVYPANTVTAEPNASDLNWVAGSIISNGGVFSTGTGVPDDSLQLFNYQNSVDAVFDLYGYYATSFKPGEPDDPTVSSCEVPAGVTTVTFPPVSAPLGGGPVTYTVTATDETDGPSDTAPAGSQTESGSGTLVSGNIEFQFTGLDNGELYSFSVTASNVDGTSDPSDGYVTATPHVC